MKRIWVLVLVISCGKAADKPAGSKPEGSAPPPPSGGPPPTKAAVQSGELVVTGAFAGTFKWKDDLNLTCTWIPGLKRGATDMTLTDGANTFMALELKTPDGKQKVTVTSGALKSASPLEADSGFTMTGSEDATHMSVTVDTDVASKEGTKAHVKGAFELACPP